MALGGSTVVQACRKDWRQGESPGPGHSSVCSAESDNRAGPPGPRVERRTARVGAILLSMRGPGHALSLTARLSAPQFRNFKIIYRRYAGLYFCICVDVNDNNLAYLEAGVSASASVLLMNIQD